MELPASGGGLSRAWPRHAKGPPGYAFHAGHCPFSCQWPVHHRNAEVGGALQLESVACRFAGPAMAGHDRDAEKSNAEPGGRALHRMRTRGHEINDQQAVNSQVISHTTAPIARF